MDLIPKIIWDEYRMICTLLFIAALWCDNERLNNQILRSGFHLTSLKFVAFQTSSDIWQYLADVQVTFSFMWEGNSSAVG